MKIEHKLLVVGFGLALFLSAMAVPGGAALARGGMEVRTADLCPTLAGEAIEDDALGTAAVVTDRRSDVTAWAVSLDSLKADTDYGVYNDGPDGEACHGVSAYSTSMTTDGDGNAFRNSAGPNANVGDWVRICRLGDSSNFIPTTVDRNQLVAILEGDLEKGGKERNKPNRCQ